MTDPVPLFPVTHEGLDPRIWDELTLLAATLWGEAEGEPYVGKLAVAYVIINRSKRRVLPVARTILARAQFSFWNPITIMDGSVKQLEKRLHVANDTPKIREECFRAAASAAWGFEEDPTGIEANHYLNVDLTREIRGGSLPDWAENYFHKPNKVIGKHTFITL